MAGMFSMFTNKEQDRMATVPPPGQSIKVGDVAGGDIGYGVKNKQPSLKSIISKQSASAPARDAVNAVSGNYDYGAGNPLSNKYATANKNVFTNIAGGGGGPVTPGGTLADSNYYKSVPTSGEYYDANKGALQPQGQPQSREQELMGMIKEILGRGPGLQGPPQRQGIQDIDPMKLADMRRNLGVGNEEALALMTGRSVNVRGGVRLPSGQVTPRRLESLGHDIYRGQDLNYASDMARTGVQREGNILQTLTSLEGNRVRGEESRLDREQRGRLEGERLGFEREKFPQDLEQRRRASVLSYAGQTAGVEQRANAAEATEQGKQEALQAGSQKQAEKAWIDYYKDMQTGIVPQMSREEFMQQIGGGQAGQAPPKQTREGYPIRRGSDGNYYVIGPDGRKAPYRQ